MSSIFFFGGDFRSFGLPTYDTEQILGLPLLPLPRRKREREQCGNVPKITLWWVLPIIIALWQFSCSRHLPFSPPTTPNRHCYTRPFLKRNFLGQWRRRRRRKKFNYNCRSLFHLSRRDNMCFPTRCCCISSEGVKIRNGKSLNNYRGVGKIQIGAHFVFPTAGR